MRYSRVLEKGYTFRHIILGIPTLVVLAEYEWFGKRPLGWPEIDSDIMGHELHCIDSVGSH